MRDFLISLDTSLLRSILLLAFSINNLWFYLRPSLNATFSSLSLRKKIQVVTAAVSVSLSIGYMVLALLGFFKIWS
jgi:hypothetical protein